MSPRRQFCRIATITALVSLFLTGCNPINRQQPNSPVPVEAVEMVFHAETHPTGIRLALHIDAIDARGGSGTNAETGLPYPWDGSRVTPYQHKLYYEPGLIIHASGSAIMGADEGDLLTCWWTDKGVEVPGSRQVAQSMAGKLAASAKVSCSATSSG